MSKRHHLQPLCVLKKYRNLLEFYVNNSRFILEIRKPSQKKKLFKNSFNVPFMPPWLIRRSKFKLIQTLNSSVLTSFAWRNSIESLHYGPISQKNGPKIFVINSSSKLFLQNLPKLFLKIKRNFSSKFNETFLQN